MAQINKEKVIVFAILAIVLAVAILVVSGFAIFTSKYNLGVVSRISIKERSTDEMELNIRYFLPSGGYSVSVVNEDEGEYTSDGMGDYDGALGKYRILVEFGDVSLADSIAKKRDDDGIIQLADDVRARVAWPSDHGFVLYIGFDKPISVEAEIGGTLNPLGGTIKIPISIVNQ